MLGKSLTWLQKNFIILLPFVRQQKGDGGRAAGDVWLRPGADGRDVCLAPAGVANNNSLLQDRPHQARLGAAGGCQFIFWDWLKIWLWLTSAQNIWGSSHGENIFIAEWSSPLYTNIFFQFQKVFIAMISNKDKTILFPVLVDWSQVVCKLTCILLLIVWQTE